MPMSTPKQSGFSMIELLIALLILAIGLFGMATLMMSSMKSNQNAAVRSQASWLAYDIVERMRLNADLAINNNNYVTAAADAAPADPGCKAAGCNAASTAQLDLLEWKTLLDQSGLTGAISRAGNEYTVTVSWQDINTSDAGTCGPASQCNFVLRANL